MNHIYSLIMVMILSLSGSAFATRSDLEDDSKGPYKQLLSEAMRKVNVKNLSASQKELLAKTSRLVSNVQEIYEEIDEEKVTYMSVIHHNISSIQEFWQHLTWNKKVSIVASVVAFTAMGGSYMIFVGAQTGEILDILNVTGNITQALF